MFAKKRQQRKEYPILYKNEVGVERCSSHWTQYENFWEILLLRGKRSVRILNWRIGMAENWNHTTEQWKGEGITTWWKNMTSLQSCEKRKKKVVLKAERSENNSFLTFKNSKSLLCLKKLLSLFYLKSNYCRVIHYRRSF